MLAQLARQQVAGGMPALAVGGKQYTLYGETMRRPLQEYVLDERNLLELSQAACN